VLYRNRALSRRAAWLADSLNHAASPGHWTPPPPLGTRLEPRISPPRPLPQPMRKLGRKAPPRFSAELGLQEKSL
jgi:hypothetical protein